MLNVRRDNKYTPGIHLWQKENKNRPTKKKLFLTKKFFDAVELTPKHFQKSAQTKQSVEVGQFIVKDAKCISKT